MSDKLEPAASVIAKFGGAAETARILGVHRSQTTRWMKPAAAGGTAGRIPARHQKRLLSAARERGIALSARDLIPED